MESLDKWLERVYSENDFGRGIATSASGIFGLCSYLLTNDWVIAFFCLIIAFPIARIAATTINERFKRRLAGKLQQNAMTKTYENLSDAEKAVVQAFVDAGGTVLTFREINNLDLQRAAIESLVQRELLWTSVTSDLMTETFALNTDLFDIAKDSSQ
ncbi:TPA: hypothetical protein ACPJ2N_004023 [Vibrio alginolyticus]